MALVCGVRSLLNPSATMRRASTSRPESVSSRMAKVGSNMAIWKISLRFFSPPLNPSFTLRLASLPSNSTMARFSRISFRNSLAVRAVCPLYLRCSFTAARMKFTMLTPGISTGCWKERKMPSCARSSGLMASRSFPLNVTLPLVTSYAGCPTSTLLSVLLPAPFCPIKACTSPSRMVRLIPFNISLPLMLACKSFMDKSGPSPLPLPVWRGVECSACICSL